MDKDVYAAQLIESLSDVVDTLNEALADKLIFNFNIGRTPDSKFALTSLTVTQEIPPKLPSPPPVTQ